MSWKTVNLGDLCSVITKGTTPSNIGESFTDSGIKYIRSEMLTLAKYISGDFLYISQETHDKLKRSQLKTGDILFSMAGVYLGKTAILRPEDTPANTNQAVALIRIDSDKANNEFVYYYLNLPAVVKTANTVQSQSAQPNINLKQIGQLKIELPDSDLQDKIVQILSAYDNLIENNQRQIRLLEEAAQRLYKEWFVDLRFPGYENTPIVDGIPEGWKKDRADTFFDITIGKTPPRAEKQWFISGNNGVPWLSIADMGNAGIYAFITSEGLTEEAVKKHNIKVVPAGTIFVSFKLTVGRVAIANTAMCTNEAIAHFYIKNSLLQAYTYCYLRNFEYNTLGNTSSISKAVNSKIIKAMPFVMPTDEIVTGFSLIVAPILNEIQNRQAACLKLQEARDRLLPKLMSGEIDA